MNHQNYVKTIFNQDENYKKEEVWSSEDKKEVNGMTSIYNREVMKKAVEMYDKLVDEAAQSHMINYWLLVAHSVESEEVNNKLFTLKQ